MVNLTKKTPYRHRHNDLIYAYANEGKWKSEWYETSTYNKETGCFRFHSMWFFDCVSGSEHDCTPGTSSSGEAEASIGCDDD